MSDHAALLHSPYKGLVPYSEEDAPFFFGRDKERRIIIDNLRGAPFTILYGPTGVGKSSVLRAGVEYYLHKLARENLAEYGAPEFIVIVFDSWRDDPVAGLIRCVHDSVKKIVASDGINHEQTQRSLPLTLKSYSDRFNSDLLIILDQFEEYFTYHPQESGKGTFAFEFPRIVNRSDLRASFLISLREDALSRIDFFKGQIPNLFDNFLRIEHLSEEAAREAIEEPIAEYNLRRGTHYSIESELMDEVCRQIRAERIQYGQGGRGTLSGASEKSGEEVRIETHFLQMVMTSLWDQETQGGSNVLRLQTLNDLGGASQIVRTTLDKEMSKLSLDEQKTAAFLFHHLVTPTGMKIALTADDLKGYTDLPLEKLCKVLDHLSKPEIRIIRPVRPASNGHSALRYEIFHDVLAPAILDWRTRHTHEQDTQIRLRKQLVKVLIALITVLIISVGTWVLREYFESQRAKEEAEAERAKVVEKLKLVSEQMSRQDQSVSFYKAIMRDHVGAVNSVVMRADGRVVATASDDKTARIWDIESGVVSELKGHSGPINKIAFSPDGKFLVTASEDKTAAIWIADTGQLFHRLIGHTGPLSSAVFSPDGKLVVTSSEDRTARVWDVASGEGRVTLQGHTAAINDARFDLVDGRYIVTASDDSTARIWNQQDGQTLHTLNGHTGAVKTVAFSPDGNFVVTASTDGTARIWNVDEGQELGILAHGRTVNTATFSNDSTLIVTAGEDNVAKVWEVKKSYIPKESVHLLTELRGHQDNVLNAVFSPDGLRVLTSSADHTARVWEVATGKSLFELRGHTDRVNGAVFSADGNLAVTAGADNIARAWNVPSTPGIRITEASLRIIPSHYDGVCPAAIRLTGNISVAGSFGEVRYRFVRKNGTPGTEKTLSFSSPGTKEVNSTYKFGGIAFPNVSGTFYLEILSPQQIQSNEADFSVKCQLQPDEEDRGTGEQPTPVAPTP